MYDLALYGHLTKDIIYDGFDCSYSIGSMANVWAALKDINPMLSIKLNPTAIGEALIYVDKINRTRISKPKLNLITNSPTLINAKWNHVLYVNNLLDLSFIPKLKGIVSFDLSFGPAPNVDILKYADYLFLSDEEQFMEFDKMCKLVRGCVILHMPDGSLVSDGKTTRTFSTNTISDVNVLGAGDIFTASVINNILAGFDIYSSVQNSHKYTYDILLKRKS